MRLSFIVCFSATSLVLIPEHVYCVESGTCDNTNVCAAIKALETKLEKLITLVAPRVVPASSCKELYDKHNVSHLTAPWSERRENEVGIFGGTAVCDSIFVGRLRQNKAYVLQTDNGKIPVYCHMTSYGIGACGGGGWTLVMKTDGHMSTFHYNSPLWTNKNEFNLPGGKTGFDFRQTKLPTYWNTPFSKICLGLKIGHQINFIVINWNANSLYSLIADGQYRATSLGRNTWKSLIGSQASLQYNCNKEGFNALGDDTLSSKARIGFLGNNENDCVTPDSRIGFGTGGRHDDSNTCGNEALDSSDKGTRHIKAMGYILVQ